MDFIDAHHHTWDHRVFPYPGVNDPHPIGDICHFKENYLITNSFSLYFNSKLLIIFEKFFLNFQSPYK